MVCGDSGAVYFADDLDGTWTKAGISGTERLYAVAFGGGQWVAGGSGVVYSAADPYGTWTAKTLDATVTALRWDEELGTWVAAVSSSIRYATDPAGDWVSVGTGSSTVRGLGKAGGVWAAVCDDTLAYTFRVPGDTPVKHLFEMGKTVGGMAGHDGIWVGALGGNLKSGYAPICVGKAHDGPWGLNFAGGGTVDITLTDVAYGSGMWTAVGKIGNYPAVMTAEDPFGAWAVRQISTSVPCTLNAVAVHEGLWVACGTSGYIWCTRDPLGAWTPYQIAGTNALLDIAVWEGLWAVLASSKLWTSSNPEGVATWTAGTPPVTSGMSLLTCGNGLWAIAYTSSSITYLSTSETPESGWTAGVKGLSGAVDGLCEAGGKWWLATSAISTSSSTSTYTVRLAQAENPTEAWTECITQTGIDGVGMAASGQEAVALCKKMVGPSSATMLASARTLPAISADRSYVYIRAKE
jgi:hypothetical protein